MRKSICASLSLVLGVFAALALGGGTVFAQGRAQPDSYPAGSSIIVPPDAWLGTGSPWMFLSDIFTRPIQGLPSSGEEVAAKIRKQRAESIESLRLATLLSTAEQQIKFALRTNNKKHFEKWFRFLKNVRDRRFTGKDKALNRISYGADEILEKLGPVFERNVITIRDDGTREKDPDPNIRLGKDQTGNGSGDGGASADGDD